MTEDERFLLECVTTELVAYTMEDFRMNMPEAMDKVYASHAYSLLVNPRTGLYYQSPRYVYDFFKEEWAK